MAYRGRQTKRARYPEWGAAELVSTGTQFARPIPRHAPTTLADASGGKGAQVFEPHW